MEDNLKGLDSFLLSEEKKEIEERVLNCIGAVRSWIIQDCESLNKKVDFLYGDVCGDEELKKITINQFVNGCEQMNYIFKIYNLKNIVFDSNKINKDLYFEVTLFSFLLVFAIQNMSVKIKIEPVGYSIVIWFMDGGFLWTYQN